MAVTDTPSAVPVAPTPASGRQPREAAAQPDRQAPTSAATAAAPAAAAAAAPSPPVAIGFSLSYDQATQRLVLEAREPGSGFVISQLPPGYVVKQFSASIGGIAPVRGATVDSAV
ncbi:MAG: hypothetical protein ACLQJR_03755 [Stellaceae bacterium]